MLSDDHHPTVNFEYEGEMYKGKEVGICIPNDSSKEDQKIIKSDELGKVYINKSKVTYEYQDEDENSDIEGVDIVSRPGYSRQEGNKWYGFNKVGEEEFNKVTDGFNTHKALKADLNVGKVMSEYYDEDKYYKLFYNPDDLKGG